MSFMDGKFVFVVMQVSHFLVQGYIRAMVAVVAAVVRIGLRLRDIRATSQRDALAAAHFYA